MDLGLQGRRAVICASSRGLGRACAEALAREGCHVVVNGLDADRLKQTVADLLALGDIEITPVVADVTTEDGRRRLFEACPQADILVNNNAGPPPGRFEDWCHDDWIKALEANMLAPILLIKAFLPGMRQRRFGRIVNITSAMVKSPKFAEMGLSSAARTGLTALSKSLSRTAIADNVTINTMMPERFDTDRQRFFAKRISEKEGISVEAARQQIIESLPAKRMGRPDEFGNTCAFLCSEHAGFMTGQSLQLDGGAYEGLF
jgi:3-oxoacyl-[acyl-carrier protein] reductase